MTNATQRGPGDTVLIGPTSGLTYQHPQAQWAPMLEALEHASFPTSDRDDLYSSDDLARLISDFGDGCFVAFEHGRPVAMGLGIRINFDLDNPLHTIHDILPSNGTSGHTPGGQWYYGTSIAVSADYRRRGIGNELYQLRKSVCVVQNLRGIVAGGVMPGYADHKADMSADEYIVGVVAGELYDPTLSFQLRNGFTIGPALPNYIADPKVDDNAALIVWHNADYVEPIDLVAATDPLAAQ